MAKLTLFSFILLFGFNSVASPESYQTLKNAYSKATSPAAPTDLEYLDYYSTWGKNRHSSCVVAFTQWTNPIDVVLARFKYIYGVQQGAGPLLPAMAGKTGEAIGISWIHGDPADESLKNLADVTRLSNTATDLIIETEASSLVPNISYSITKIRKDGQKLLFSYLYQLKDESEPTQTYGYCYKN